MGGPGFEKKKDGMVDEKGENVEGDSEFYRGESGVYP
jgi:hypothetical protein